MNTSQEKNFKKSKTFLITEIILNIIGSLIIICGFFLSKLPEHMLWNIPLLVFLLINSIIKLLCLKYAYSSKKRAILHIPLLVYLLLIIIIGGFSQNIIIFKIIFFAVIFILNIKFNHFIKFTTQNKGAVSK